MCRAGIFFLENAPHLTIDLGPREINILSVVDFSVAKGEDQT